MLDLDVEEFAMTNILLPSTVGAIDIIGSYVESEFDPELLLVGASSLEGFQHTDELRVMNYKEAMASDPVKWKEAVRQEFLKFKKYKVLCNEKMYIEVPYGMEEYLGSKQDTVCEMLVPLYGTKQAAECFYKTLKKKVEKLGYSRSKADFTLFYRWFVGRLLVFATWVDDLLVCGEDRDIDAFERDIRSELEIKAEPEFNEYLGNAVTIKRDATGLCEVKFTQPVLLQKLKDNCPPDNNRIPRTPAAPGTELSKDESSAELSEEEAFKFRSLLATIMNMVQWSRPDILQPVCALARYMHAPREVHWYMYGTLYRGLSLRPVRLWDGSEGYEFVISGRSNLNYAANVDDRHSVTGCRTQLEGAPIMQRSATQRHVTLSVTEAESAARVTEAQDMVYWHNVLTFIGLKVKLPVVLEMDNKGAVDLANSLSVGGRTRHVDVCMHYLCELKDQGMIVIKHIPGEDNETDIFTKNTSTATFNKHVVQYVGHDEYVDAVDGAVNPSS